MSSANENHSILHQLMSTIEQRYRERPAGSYTTRLFEGGDAKIGSKILEEAQEVVEAAGEPGTEGRAHLLYEAGDVVYHLFVMLANHEISLNELEQELGRRFGVSGIEEKASRKTTE